MTGRKRILATIAHQEPDRLPIARRVWVWLMDYSGDASLDGYLGFRREFGSDAIGSVIGPRPNYFRSYAETYDLPDVEVEQRAWQDAARMARRRAARPLTAPISTGGRRTMQSWKERVGAEANQHQLPPRRSLVVGRPGPAG